MMMFARVGSSRVVVPEHGRGYSGGPALAQAWSWRKFLGGSFQCRQEPTQSVIPRSSGFCAIFLFMKRISSSRCAARALAPPLPRRPLCPYAVARNYRIQARFQSTAAVAKEEELEVELPEATPKSSQGPRTGRRRSTALKLIPSPHPSAAEKSIKLHALRSRLTLPERFPLPTLARTLVHPSADPDPAFNNASLSILGRHLLSYYITEWLLCNYPRLPIAVLFAAVEAYVGPQSLATIAKEWGIEAAAEPGGEVDPGLLQFRRIESGEALPAAFKQQVHKWNITDTHKIMRSDEFGSLTAPPGPHDLQDTGVPSEIAAQSFVRAFIGALHVHLGAPLVKRFFRDHFLSRHLDISTLFDFRTPTRDLSRLCAREGFEPPIARLISETGRLSRHPVFVVGVYSGNDKLGEGSGSSLNEARIRAAVAALKAWYLYKPLEVVMPSSTEGEPDTSKWRPNLIDCGEIIV